MTFRINSIILLNIWIFTTLVQFFNKPSSLVYISLLLPYKNVHQLLFFWASIKYNFTPYWQHKQWLKKPKQLAIFTLDQIQNNQHAHYKISVIYNNTIANKTLFISTANSNSNRFNLSFRLLPLTHSIQVTHTLLNYLQIYFNTFNSSALLFLLTFKKPTIYNLIRIVQKVDKLFTSRNEYKISPLLLHTIKNI